ncbi:MAG: DUF4931 domain-containing protein [Candidatus Wildermuthbacteria bacterium]|nr:DUF4931 domain-containing protein [Candidatus Wildermuthbacteria bacterium]
MQKDKKEFPSELRYNLVSQEWVVIAKGRSRRPDEFASKTKKPRDNLKQCPFEKFARTQELTAAFFHAKETRLSQGKFIPVKWTTISLPNKYPAFTIGGSLETRHAGPYKAMDGVGFHEVVVTRDHKRDIPDFEAWEVRELIDMYQERYLDLSNEKFVNYIAIFKNKGAGAGATVAHPHSQIIATPILHPDIERSIKGSKDYWDANKKCVHCSMISWDTQDGQRIVYENDQFIALCPFASTVSFEIRVYPKEHLAYFERADEGQKAAFAEVLLVALQKIKKALGDPDYNYFVHTAPADGKNYDHYHWHLEILPKTSTWAGFELGTGIRISTIEPEQASAFLREQ